MLCHLCSFSLILLRCLFGYMEECKLISRIFSCFASQPRLIALTYDHCLFLQSTVKKNNPRHGVPADRGGGLWLSHRMAGFLQRITQTPDSKSVYSRKNGNYELLGD